MTKQATFESCLSKEAATVILPPEERLFAHNLAHWFAQAAKAVRFCRICDWPLEDWLAPGAAPSTEDRCTVCVALEVSLVRSDYWRRLDDKEKQARRNMGLDNA